MNYDFKSAEEEILKFWNSKKIREKIAKRNSKGPKFFHLDGPPYATGNPHPGTAINRGLKDLVRRFKRMKGYNVWDQPGFDMHGLPIESMVEKKLGLKNKEEIKKYGVKKFVEECRKYAFQYLGVMGSIFSRLGEWADWDNPYETTNNNYIDGVWWALKKIWERDALYEGSKVLPWCPHCGTALASNYEVVHKPLREKSIYVKFKVIDAPNTYLIIWTTTPWTLSSNMAVMANPKIGYSFAKVGDEEWIMASNLVKKVMKLAGKDYSIIREAKGKELKGLRYEHPFLNEVPYHKEDHGSNAYSVVMSEKYVNLSDGTGLVHCAPGCGPEDQEVGNENAIPSFNPTDENGIFTHEAGAFKGWKAKTDDSKFIELLDKKGILVATEMIEHDYPHCERCKTPIIFRNTKQWFIRVTNFRDKMLEENKKVNWVPRWVGERQFASWLKGIKDWCISRQRFWGIPLPVWACDKCGKIEVIGGVEDLSKRAEVPDDLHKPYIDKVTWKCECGGTFKRNPDVIDVWIDSACAPFSSLPMPREKWMKKLGKIDFITESKDQIRGWFYSLMGIGVAAFGECPYTNILMHAFITDENGKKLSKRLGNYMSMTEIFEKYGADAFRVSLMSNFTPGVDLRFSKEEMARAYRTLNVIWNTHEYILRNMKFFNVKPSSPKAKTLEDKWLLSRLASTAKTCEESMKTYHLEDYTPAVLNLFIEDMSRFYIKLIRKKLDKERINTLFYVFMEGLKLLGPIVPFISEKMYQNMGGNEESLFMESIPSAKRIDKKLEEQMSNLKSLITLTLAARDKAGINVRWPIKEVISSRIKIQDSYLKSLFLDFVNAKKLSFAKPKGIEYSYKPNIDSIKRNFPDSASELIPLLYNEKNLAKKLNKKGNIEIRLKGKVVEMGIENFTIEERLPEGIEGGEGVYIKTEMDKSLLSEGYSREIIRRMQELRKQLGLVKEQPIEAFIEADKELHEMIKPHLNEMKSVTGSKEIRSSMCAECDAQKEFKIRKFRIRIGIRRI